MASSAKNPMIGVKFRDMISMFSAKHMIPQLPDTPTEFTVKATMRDGHESEVRVYKPRKPSSAASVSASASKTPLVVLIHGGGFCIGHWSHMGAHARSIAHLHGVTAVSIAYRLAPAHKFPQAPHDVWDTLQWLSSESGLQALGGDVDTALGLVVGGISAGANLSTVAVQQSALLTADNAAGKLSHPVTGLWASIPCYYEPDTVPEKYRDLWVSRTQNAVAPVINADALEFVREAYAFDARSPDYCPGYGVKGAAAKMPRTHIQVAGQDPLRDDGLVFEKVLQDNGVETRLDTYAGVPHGFAEITEIPLAHKSRADALRGFGWLLGKAEPTDEQCREAWTTAVQTATTPTDAST